MTGRTPAHYQEAEWRTWRQPGGQPAAKCSVARQTCKCLAPGDGTNSGMTTRPIRGWNLSPSLDRFLTLTALERALVGNVPVINHSDRGVQLVCPALRANLITV